MWSHLGRSMCRSSWRWKMQHHASRGYREGCWDPVASEMGHPGCGPTTVGSQCQWLWPGHCLPVVPLVATAVGFCCTTEMFSFPFISPLSAFPPVTGRDIWPCDCIWIIYTFSWNEAHSEERKPFTLRLGMQEAWGLQCLLCPRRTSRGLPSGWEVSGRSWAPNYVSAAEVTGPISILLK